MIVGSAPPERAGAASGISETGLELGGALGISLLGSLGIAIYRGQVAASLPPTVPPDVAEAARDTLGAAIAAAATLPADLGAVVIGIVREAFIHGMQLGAVISAVVAFGVAGLALATLRSIDSSGAKEADAADPRARVAPNLRTDTEAC